MRFEAVELPDKLTGGSLYYQNFNLIASFFPGGDPYQPDTLKKRYQHLMATDKLAARDKVAAILAGYNRELGAGEQSIANAEKLGQPDVVAVVTGQQAGMLTGPLLTIYKALTAVALAEYCRNKLDIEAIPVFWIASEDHDFREINHVHFLGEKYRRKTVYLPYKVQGQPPMQSVPAGEACNILLRECLRQFRNGPYFEDAETLLRSTLESTGNICDWFGAILVKLFDGLVCLNPMLPELRRWQLPVFQQGINETGEINELLADNERELVAGGFTAPVQKKKNHTHLFIVDRGNRVPVFAVEDGFQAGERKLSHREMNRLIKEHPEQVSPDVILRPLSQEIILPVLAYVAGPGEIDYWAQLPGVFRHFGFTMPPIFPRASLTLVEPALAELMHSYGLTAEKIVDSLEDELSRLLKEKDAVGLENIFRQGEHDIESCFRRMKQNLGEPMASGLEQVRANSLRKILKEWGKLEKKAWQEHRKQHRNLIRDFQQIGNQLLPTGHKQEAVYNLFSYYTVYGPELLKALMPGLLRPVSHQFVYLEGNQWNQ